jgi:nitrite reductase (NO-forming)
MKRLILIPLFAGLTFIAYNVYAHLPGKRISENTGNVVISSEFQATKYPKGARIYNQLCFRCHQPNGMGIQGVFPPLKGSDYLKKATKRKLLEQVLKGSNENLTVNGTHYFTPMPAQVSNIDDAVEVVNYVLNAWGNNYGVATAADGKGLIQGNK